MKASDLFKQNIDSILRARGQSRHELAVHCRRTDPWLSKILGKDDRNVPMKYLDRMAGFFGLAVYQLFQPGISPLTERRRGLDRRQKHDRRIGAVARQAAESSDPLVDQLNALTYEERQRVGHWISVTLLARGRGRGLAVPADPDVTSVAPTATTPAPRARRRTGQ